MINLKINGKQIQVEDGSTIMEAAQKNNIFIPSLCYLEGVHKYGSCRICVVEVEGAKSLLASCITPAMEGMSVRTNTTRVRKARRILYELMLSDHPRDCLSCSRNQNCELQALGERIGVPGCRFEGETSSEHKDSTLSITHDAAKCILCRRCVTVCNEIQQVGAINAQNRGFKTVISAAMELPLSTVNCTGCGQCTLVCPVGALKETPAIPQVWDMLNDSSKRKIVQVAPAIRAAIGEEFGYEPGTLVTGKLAAVLRQVGFDDIFDTNFAADLTIIEEGTELLGRLKNALTGGDAKLPMITSCSPGWIKYAEHFFPDCLDYLSTCKSPHMMLGALAKMYYAEKIGVDPKDVYVTSIMPCTAKKFEIARPEMQNDGLPNVDAVLTTRELAGLIKQVGIDFRTMPDEQFDNPLGLSSGAADIFGVTGGVMEAALRTVFEIVTGKELPFDKLHVTPIMGLEQIKEAAITIEDTLPEYSFLKGVTVRVAVTSGLKGAKQLLQQIADGTSPYHFIEVMCCPGGCISGGGQPRPTNNEVRLKRLEAIYREDEGKELRKSHNNPYIKKLYEEFLGEPNGHRSHELLHTHYTKRGKYNELG
jgi:NADP-reducing hydrogenase subunit HndD